jgi:hypothetical protein
MYIKVIPLTTKTFIYLLLLLIINNTAQHNTTHYTILTVRIPAQENLAFIVTLVSPVVPLSFESLNKVTCKICRQCWREENADFSAIVQKPLLDLSHHGYFRKLYLKTLLGVSAIMDFGINEYLTLIGFDFGFSGGPVCR